MPPVNTLFYCPAAPPHLLANALEFRTTVFHSVGDHMCQVDVDALDDLRRRRSSVELTIVRVIPADPALAKECMGGAGHSWIESAFHHPATGDALDGRAPARTIPIAPAQWAHDDLAVVGNTVATMLASAYVDLMGGVPLPS